MNPATYVALKHELEQIKTAGALAPALSMGGLAGLTALEGHGAMDKKKSKKDRMKSGLGAAATGSILASEAIHNKDMIKGGLKKGLGLLKKGSAIGLTDGVLTLFAKNAGLGTLTRGMVADAAHLKGGFGHVGQAAAKAPALTHKLNPAMSMVPGGKFTGGAAAPAAKLTGMDKIRAMGARPAY